MLRRPRWRVPAALGTLLAATLAGWTLTAVSAADQPGGAQPLPGDPQKGTQVYNAQGCTACHGANLEGGIGPKLNPIVKLPGVEQPLDAAFLQETIKNGRQGDPGYSSAMPAFGGKLPDQDLKDLVSFIIDANRKGPAGLGPVELARSNVFWVTLAIGLMILLTYLLARYNMRWIDRRAAARRDRERTG